MHWIRLHIVFGDYSGEISTKISEVNGLKSTVAEMGAASAGLEAKLTSTKTQLEDALARVAQLETLSTQQGDMIEAFKVRIIMVNPQNVAKPKFAKPILGLFQAKERGYETERRVLHNTIQELKGNIRVFCRIRPLLGKLLLKFLVFNTRVEKDVAGNVAT